MVAAGALCRRRRFRSRLAGRAPGVAGFGGVVWAPAHGRRATRATIEISPNPTLCLHPCRHEILAMFNRALPDRWRQSERSHPANSQYKPSISVGAGQAIAIDANRQNLAKSKPWPSGKPAFHGRPTESLLPHCGFRRVGRVFGSHAAALSDRRRLAVRWAAQRGGLRSSAVTWIRGRMCR